MSPVASFLIALLSTVAQVEVSPAISIVQPEFEGQVFALTDGEKLTALERASAVGSMKLRAMGYGGIKTSYKVDGSHSPVTFSAEKIPYFVVRVADQAADPGLTIELYEFRVDAKARQLNYSSISVFGTKVKGAEKKHPLSFAKFGSASLKVSAPGLTRGEYCFNTHGSAPVATVQARDVWCFGVD